MNKTINLLGNKDHADTPPASRRLKIIRAIAMLLLFSVSSAAIILYTLVALSPLPQVQQQEKQALATLKGSHPEMTKIALLEDRLSSISSILTERNTYDAVLDSIASKMPPGLTIAQISMKKKNLSMTVTSESLDPLTQFVDNLKLAAESNQYKSVILNNIITNNQSNKFSLTISIGL